MNHAAAKAFSANQGQVASPIPPQAVDFLLGRTAWPFGMGLCVAGDPANTDLGFDPFTKIEHSTTNFWGARPILRRGDQTLGGGLVELNGVGFGLSLFPIRRDYTEANGVKNPFRGARAAGLHGMESDGIGKASQLHLVRSNRTQVHRLHDAHENEGLTMSLTSDYVAEVPIESSPSAIS